jgi:hypothetical protein
MAPGYGQYNNYYDPVGSQSNQSQGYAYPNQSAATTASQPATTAYSSTQYPSYPTSSYSSSQQYGSAAVGQQNDGRRNSGATSSATGARASGVNGHEPQASAIRTSTTQHHDTGAGSWGNPNHSSSHAYNTGLQPPSRTQSNTSPQYTSSVPASTVSRSSYTAPSQQTHTSRQTYGTTQHHQTVTEPSRCASPLHAVQAQQQQHQQSHQSHGRQPSRTSNHQPSPVTNARAPLQLNDHRQGSASVEPVNTTVDPSQVYDSRAEREKKAKAEAEKRRKMEEIEAAKKAEEDRIAEEQRKADEAVRQAEETKRQAEEVRRQAEELRVNEERRRAEQAKRKSDEKTAAVKAAVKTEAARKKEEQRKARESKSAADTLASLATSSIVPEASNLPPPANDEEAEMRAMFQKMREFNSKNPAMLAKLWEEERRSHGTQSQSPQPSVAVAQSVAPAPQPSARKKAPSSTPLSASTSTPAQIKSSRGANAIASGSTPAPVANAPTMHNQAPETNVSQAHVPAANTHLWPPGKKGLLAEIAARWLHSVNPQRVVTTTEILNRLDMNPNYVQLCESLEAMGLRFERAAFARELLRGIPPAGPANQNQTSPKVTEASIMSANGTVAQATGTVAPEVNVPKPKRSRATKAEMEQRRSLNLVDGLNKKSKGKGVEATRNGMVDYQMPSFSVPDDFQTPSYVTHAPDQAATSFAQPSGMSPQFDINDDYSRQPSLSVQPSVHPERRVSGVQQGIPTPVGSAQQTEPMRSPSPPRQPADKEEAARKRGFGDLVDLTAGDSDDEDLPPMKVMKPSEVPRPAESHQQHMQRLQQQLQQQPNRQNQQPGGRPYNGKFEILPSNVSSPGNMGSPFQAPAGPTTAKLYVQPNGSFGKAPAAVMSVATAPNMTGPAIAPTVKTPTVPSNTPQPIRRKGPSNEQLQHERIRGKMVVEPIMRDRVARRSTYDSRTIARDVLLATGRHPDMRPLNSHLNAMQKLLGDRGGMLDQSGNKSDLATIKWDILDPDPPKKVSAPAKKQPDQEKNEGTNGIARTTELNGEDQGDADDEEDLSSVVKQKPVEGSMRGFAFDLRTNANASADASANNTPLALKVPKKRGRPKRSDTSAPNAIESPSVNSPIPNGTPGQMSGRPASTPSGAVGYAAFRQYDENGNEIKKKGRPVGWRKNVHSREAAGLTPKKSMSAKSKPATARAESQLQEPKYQVYKCKWEDCGAELHSLEVLKKHVTKIHGRPDTGDEYHCMWQGCGLDSSFNDISDWLGHVDKEHMQPVAWKLGDGPRGGLSGELLFDDRCFDIR